MNHHGNCSLLGTLVYWYTLKPQVQTYQHTLIQTTLTHLVGGHDIGIEWESEKGDNATVSNFYNTQKTDRIVRNVRIKLVLYNFQRLQHKHHTLSPLVTPLGHIVKRPFPRKRGGLWHNENLSGCFILAIRYVMIISVMA